MAGQERAKPGLFEKWREKKRLKRERTGDTREKKGERPASEYNAADLADRTARAGLMGGGLSGGGGGG